MIYCHEHYEFDMCLHFSGANIQWQDFQIPVSSTWLYVLNVNYRLKYIHNLPVSALWSKYVHLDNKQYI